MLEGFTLPPAIAAKLAKRSGTSTFRSSIDARIASANAVPGNLPGTPCPLCLNRGYVFVNDDGYMVSRECECMARRKSEQIIERSGLKELLERYTLKAWEKNESWQEQAYEIAESYAGDPSGWLVVYGTPGTGKSHLCTAVCSELMQRGMPTRYMLWRDISVQAKASVNDSAEYQSLVEPLKTVRVLYIDDFLKTGKGQQPTVGDINLAFEILNYRYNDRRKITIISTERSVEEMLDIDEALGSRIYEKSKGHLLDFRGKGNFRLK